MGQGPETTINEYRVPDGGHIVGIVGPLVLGSTVHSEGANSRALDKLHQFCRR
jgi:hypothetical protein